MAAALKACAVCGRHFYGRADATYCANSCRQKAYRQRSAHVAPSLPAGPVPDGDEWMHDRFGMRAAEPSAGRHRADSDRGHAASSVLTQRRIAEAEEAAANTIQSYVRSVAEIARYDSAADITDFDTPLGDALPAGLDTATSARLAADLSAALPRLRELASLLERRARLSQHSTPPTEAHKAAATSVPLPYKMPLDRASSHDGDGMRLNR